MKRNGKRYDEEFKKMLVELYNSKQKTVSELEREYGVTKVTIYSWINQYSEFKIDENTTMNNKDINEMQREINRLKEENEILKKAMAIFAKK
ncbi:MAG TPA: transposase [Haloplasmataceae bacterium]